MNTQLNLDNVLTDIFILSARTVKYFVLITIKVFRQNIDSLAEAVELPETNLGFFNPDEETPEEIARKTRYSFRIPKGPVPDLVNLLENKGILVVKTDLFTEKIDGLSTISDKGNHVIFLNEAETGEVVFVY